MKHLLLLEQWESGDQYDINKEIKKILNIGLDEGVNITTETYGDKMYSSTPNHRFDLNYFDISRIIITGDENDLNITKEIIERLSNLTDIMLEVYDREIHEYSRSTKLEDKFINLYLSKKSINILIMPIVEHMTHKDYKMGVTNDLYIKYSSEQIEIWSKGQLRTDIQHHPYPKIRNLRLLSTDFSLSGTYNNSIKMHMGDFYQGKIIRSISKEYLNNVRPFTHIYHYTITS